jgi:hypothetical protein
MSRFAWIVTLTALAAVPSAAQTAIPDVRGIWKGESESIVLGSAHPHHTATQPNEPQFRSVAFTLTIDKQDGRRFSGTFSSARSSERVIAVISRSGAILLADDEGYTHGIWQRGPAQLKRNQEIKNTCWPCVRLWVV